jgi:ABC-type uncharacterized transport system ATPase subunit
MNATPTLGQNADGELLLEVAGVSKRFPQVLANDDVSFSVRRGEIHCLLGENGAGKSTLAEILYGVHRPDSGTIRFAGKPVTISAPRDAIHLGIGMVHQHFVLVPPLSVLENIVIGTQHSGLRLDMRTAGEKLGSLCAAYDLALNPNAKVSQLCVGEQQWVEILKALYVGVELLILDEPTASLTPLEAEKLFVIIKKMRADGLSLVFITHKLNEVMEVSDRVTVMRKGKVVSTVNTAETTPRELARMMVGREIVFRLDKGHSEPGATLLEISGLCARDDRGVAALQGISLNVRRSEIVAVAGVSGNGQKELYDVLTGVRKATAGQVLLEGKNLTNGSPSAIASSGVASVPEDRIRQGLVMNFRIDENLMLGIQRKTPFSSGGLLNQGAINGFARDAIEAYDIATPSAKTVTRVLSGGNLQKVILARELSQKPKCLIISQPTRGLDVGATEYVRQRLLDERDRGAGILLISEDLDEVFNLATRIAVMFKGKIVGVLDADKATREEVGLLMAGCEVTG